MIYIAYLPKKKDEEISKRKVNQMLKVYSEKSNYENSIIASPGFMSTSSNTIKEYLDSFSKIVTSDKKKTELGLLHGMNGSHSVWISKGSGTASNILDTYNTEMLKHHFFNIDMDVNAEETDHRKMMCFFSRKQPYSSKINREHLGEFMDTIIVNAILIGSSNQSNFTYFDKVAKKGEADIFIVKDTYFSLENKKEIELFRKNIDNSTNTDTLWEMFGCCEDSVVTESIFGKGYNDPQKFMNDILEDLLRSGLN